MNLGCFLYRYLIYNRLAQKIFWAIYQSFPGRLNAFIEILFCTIRFISTKVTDLFGHNVATDCFKFKNSHQTNILIHPIQLNFIHISKYLIFSGKFERSVHCIYKTIRKVVGVHLRKQFTNWSKWNFQCKWSWATESTIVKVCSCLWGTRTQEKKVESWQKVQKFSPWLTSS